jgi:peptidylprolyl isomerase
MRSFPWTGALAALALTFLPTAGFAGPDSAEDAITKTEPGLQVIDTVVGTGVTPKPGQICTVNYTGWLYQNGEKGKKFDSSSDHGKPFEFPIGERRVIGGWDEGVATMQVGGKRTLIVPPELAYGERGAGHGVIPPNATLIFEIELVGVRD